MTVSGAGAPILWGGTAVNWTVPAGTHDTKSLFLANSSLSRALPRAIAASSSSDVEHGGIVTSGYSAIGASDRLWMTSTAGGGANEQAAIPKARTRPTDGLRTTPMLPTREL